MRKIYTCFFFLLTLYLPAQNFVPPGATWHYANSLFYPFWEKMVYEKDTLVAGKNCMKMHIERQFFGQAGPGAPFSPSALQHSSRLFYQEGDTLFEGTPNSSYRILFVFNASVGDRWETAPPVSYDSTCTLYNYTELIDTGTVSINGRNLRYWDVAPADSSFMAMSGRFIEQIGYLNGGFYTQFQGPSPEICHDIFVDAAYYVFSCFESDSIGFYNVPQWPYSECEFNFSLDATAGPDLHIFPNPVTDRIYIYSGLDIPCTAEISDMQGQKVMQAGKLYNGQSLELGALPPGVYVLQLSVEGNPLARKKIIKE